MRNMATSSAVRHIYLQLASLFLCPHPQRTTPRSAQEGGGREVGGGGREGGRREVGLNTVLWLVQYSDASYMYIIMRINLLQ